MEKALCYKEWIKTRYYYFLAILVSWGMTGYCILKINRAITMKGAPHLWEVMLGKDVVFIDLLTYLPLLIGIFLAWVQFVPEMQQNRLKLTLHLPVSQYKTISIMLSFGIILLLIGFASDFLLLWLYLQKFFATELTSRILLTAIPWFTAGITGYLLTAWICLEPTWKRRILNILISAAILRIFFLPSVPESYNCFLPILILFTILTLFFSLLSVSRFRAGKQD